MTLPLSILLRLAAAGSLCGSLAAQSIAQVAVGRQYLGDYGGGFPAAAEPGLKQFKAVLQPGRAIMVITTPEGASLAFTFVPRSQPVADCQELNRHTLCEVADLTPVGALPLVIGGRVFRNPVVKVVCRTGWLTLADGVPDCMPVLGLRLDKD